jgi:serpin B
MFMSGKKTCGYVEYKGNQMVALPYKDGRYAMYILLPAENLKESDLLSYMSESGVDEVMKNMSRKKVKLTMPKFKVEHEMSLVKTLEAMGVRSVFTSAADLTGIAHGPLAVSDVFQKTVVDVDESGSEAAAVTTIMVNMTSARIEPDPVMTVDRPFYYMIADMDAGRILFAGRMMNL